MTASRGKVSPPILILTMLILTVAPALQLYVHSLDGAQFSIEAPRQLGDFEVKAFEPGWKPVFVDPDEEQHFLLTAGEEQRFILHIVYYREERQGKEVINTENHLTDPNWKFDQDTVFLEGAGSNEGFTVNEILVSQLSGKSSVRYWYLIGGRVALSPLQAKLLHLRAILDGRKDAALIMLRSECRFQCDKDLVDQATVAVYENVKNWFQPRP